MPLATTSAMPANSAHCNDSPKASQPISVAKTTPLYCRLAASSVPPRENARVMHIWPIAASTPIAASPGSSASVSGCQPVAAVVAIAPITQLTTENQKTIRHSGSPSRPSMRTCR